jgi:Ca-activated chloride channel family protein
VAVLEKRRNTEGAAHDVEQPLPLPLGVSDLAVGGFNSVPEPDLIVLLIAVTAVLLFLSRRRLVRWSSRG